MENVVHTRRSLRLTFRGIVAIFGQPSLPCPGEVKLKQSSGEPQSARCEPCSHKGLEVDQTA